MANKTINATIEILGKFYPIRCLDDELKSLQQAAALLNEKMTSVQESGKVINLERIAIISALNLAHQYLQQEQEKQQLMDAVNQRIKQLQNKLDTAVNKITQTELIYTTE